MDPEARVKGISIIKSSYKQYSDPLHSGNKIIGTYINSTMAVNEAIKKGADEAILLDKNNYVSEGSGENIFFVKDNIIYTPTVEHCLNGITRQSVIKIAKDFNYDVIEKNLKFDELLDCDEAFFTGTAAEITPITKIDNQRIGIGLRGDVTEKLQRTYLEIVSGNNLMYKDWLSFVK